jgi:hypothetical protein
MLVWQGLELSSIWRLHFLCGTTSARDAYDSYMKSKAVPTDTLKMRPNTHQPGRGGAGCWDAKSRSRACAESPWAGRAAAATTRTSRRSPCALPSCRFCCRGNESGPLHPRTRECPFPTNCFLRIALMSAPRTLGRFEAFFHHPLHPRHPHQRFQVSGSIPARLASATMYP